MNMTNPTVLDLQHWSKLALVNKHRGQSGVYRWVNKLTGDSFVGSSIDLARRISEYLNPNHLSAALLRGDSRIYRALLKYGPEAFTFEVLEYYVYDPALSRALNIRALRVRETHFIVLLKPTYNILQCAGFGPSGHQLSAETRRRMSQAALARYASTPHHRRGATQSEESRAIMRKHSTSTRPVYCYGPDKVLIERHDSIALCSEASGINRASISRGILSGKLVQGRFYFSTSPLERPPRLGSQMVRRCSCVSQAVGPHRQAWPHPRGVLATTCEKPSQVTRKLLWHLSLSSSRDCHSSLNKRWHSPT